MSDIERTGVPGMGALAQLGLPPGFRFYPTDEELMVQYLCRKVAGHQFTLPIIGEVDLYKFDPWDLPDYAIFGDKEWYFFSPRDRKYPNGSRPNRVAGKGYWKATGTDKVITTQGRKVGIKKALVFYTGKAPKGKKTNWIMHEYRLFQASPSSSASKLDDWVLCRIYRKNSGAGKPTAGVSSMEQSKGGSPSSSSSLLDDVLESIPEIDDGLGAYQGMNSLMIPNQPGFQNYGSGPFDWCMQAGLTSGPQVGEIGLTSGPNQLDGHASCRGCDACLPPVIEPMESPQEKFSHRVVEDAQSGLTTQRVNSPGAFFTQSSDMMMSQGYPESVQPYGIRYTAPMGGFGFSL